MINRLLFATLLAAGGAGFYMFALANPSTLAPTDDSAANSSNEWQVEYVDGDGNPLDPNRSLNVTPSRLRVSSPSIFKRSAAVSSTRTAASDKLSPARPPKSGG